MRHIYYPVGLEVSIEHWLLCPTRREKHDALYDGVSAGRWIVGTLQSNDSSTTRRRTRGNYPTFSSNMKRSICCVCAVLHSPAVSKTCLLRSTSGVQFTCQYFDIQRLRVAQNTQLISLAVPCGIATQRWWQSASIACANQSLGRQKKTCVSFRPGAISVFDERGIPDHEDPPPAPHTPFGVRSYRVEPGNCYGGVEVGYPVSLGRAAEDLPNQTTSRTGDRHTTPHHPLGCPFMH